jgi:hypothetical protein
LTSCLTDSYQGVQFSVGPFKVIDIAEEARLNNLILGMLGQRYVRSSSVGSGSILLSVFVLRKWQTAKKRIKLRIPTEAWTTITHRGAVVLGIPMHETYVWIMNVHFPYAAAEQSYVQNRNILRSLIDTIKSQPAFNSRCDHIFVSGILNFGVHSICFSWLI